MVLNQVIVRFGTDQSDEEGDRLTIATIAQIQQDGVCFAGGTKWRGRQAMRISVISSDIDEMEGPRSADAMIDAYRKVCRH